jgi:hypothetical protein
MQKHPVVNERINYLTYILYKYRQLHLIIIIGTIADVCVFREYQKRILYTRVS